MSQSHRPLQEQWKIISWLSHHRDCAWHSLSALRHHKLHAFFLTLMMALTLTLPALSAFVVETIATQEEQLTPVSEVTIYLNHDAKESQITEIINQIDHENLLENLRFISPDEGLTQLAQSMHIESVINSIDTNPLPGALIGTPSPGVESYQMEVMKHQLEQHPFVESIDLNLSWFEQLHSVLKMAENLGIAIAGILCVIMLLTISNLTFLMAQKSEQDIDVYELIGANQRFIKRPFLYTGFYFGLAAAMLNWLILLGLYQWTRPYWQSLQQHFHLHLPLIIPSPLLIVASLIVPTLLGITGAHLALRQFFKQRSASRANS